MASIADAPRRASYTANNSAGPFPVPFPLFDESGIDLLVTVDDETAIGWTFSGDLESGFYGAPNTWVNGSILFSAPISGDLVITGRRSPRRSSESQYQEGRGVPARDLNFEFNLLSALARELYDRFEDLSGLLLTEEALEAALVTALAYVGLAREWAEKPYGQVVSGTVDGRSSLHWSVVSQQFATEAATYAGMVGAIIYDFGLLSDAVVGEEDWGTL